MSYAALDDAGGTGQAIVNTHLAVVNYAEKLAPSDEGENLLSCIYAPVLRTDPNGSYPDVESLVGSGNEAPKADNLVVRESPVYDQGEFAGVTAEGARTRSSRWSFDPARAKHIASWVSRWWLVTSKESACGRSPRQ